MLNDDLLDRDIPIKANEAVANSSSTQTLSMSGDIAWQSSPMIAWPVSRSALYT
jgi:hypothetical protein